MFIELRRVGICCVKIQVFGIKCGGGEVIFQDLGVHCGCQYGSETGDGGAVWSRDWGEIV